MGKCWGIEVKNQRRIHRGYLLLPFIRGKYSFSNYSGIMLSTEDTVIDDKSVGLFPHGTHSLMGNTDYK